MRGWQAGALLVLFGLLAACNAASTPAQVPVSIEVDHRFGAAPLVLGRDYGLDPRTPTVNISRLSYYLGRFRLKARDGRWIESASDAEPGGGYVIVDPARPQTLRFEALRVPPGDYTALEFLVGVDADHNHAGAQTGALDPEHGLFWTWKTGYIFFALEGHSPASAASGGALTFHVGGDARLARSLVLPLSPALRVDGSTPANLSLRADIAEFFRDLPLEQMHTVMSAEASAPLADRYAMLFDVEPATPRLAATRVP